jgi:hypothetical protein
MQFVALVIYIIRCNLVNRLSLIRPLELMTRTVPSQADVIVTLNDLFTMKLETQASVVTSRSGLKSPSALEFTGMIQQYKAPSPSVVQIDNTLY